MNRALVLGSNGFIGSHLVDALLKRGVRVRGYDRNPSSKAVPSFEPVTGSFLDYPMLAEALAGVDVVYHCISSTVPGTSNLDPVSDIEVNLVGSVRLLEQMVKLRVPKIVYFSSGGTVYGSASTDPVAEDHPLDPITSYGVVKVAFEKYIGMFRALHGMEAVILRPSNPYGPRQGHIGVQGAISTFLRRLQAKESIDIWGDGRTVRDYLYIDDLARVAAMAGDRGANGVFNVGSGVGVSLNHVLQVIQDVTGVAPQVIRHERRQFDVSRSVLDVARASEAFGWQTTVSLEEGISRTWAWMHEAGEVPP